MKNLKDIIFDSMFNACLLNARTKEEKEADEQFPKRKIGAQLIAFRGFLNHKMVGFKTDNSKHWDTHLEKKPGE